ncbi:hypothetical protein B0H12DRAFT_1230109 [Mycena haematopus]|nr:hypothetical protein B0H12DRAFT_1230109 [Mycena haematopus]
MAIAKILYTVPRSTTTSEPSSASESSPTSSPTSLPALSEAVTMSPPAAVKFEKGRKQQSNEDSKKALGVASSRLVYLLAAVTAVIVAVIAALIVKLVEIKENLRQLQADVDVLKSL